MSIAQSFRAEAAKRILIKDGPYGTAIQGEKLQSADYCGGLDLMKDQRGNNDLLNLTKPDVVRSICTRFAEAGAEISTRPFQLVTGRRWLGSAFGGARGRTDVPRIVDWYMDGKINIDDLITHTLPLERINDGFDLMKRGESIRSVVVY